MKKIIYLSSISLMILLNGCSVPKVNDISPENISNKPIAKSELQSTNTKIDSKDIEDNIKKISSYIRNYGSDGELKTSEYLKDKLLEYGYNVNFQEFDVFQQDLKSTIHAESNIDYLNNNLYNSSSLGKARNIIATQSDFDENKKTIYLTAHYDTTDDTIGIVDNTSGTSVVLELAKALKDTNDSFNINIVFFSAEEYFRAGSKYFVSNLTNKDKESIIGCLNFDMIGEKGTKDIAMHSVTGNDNILSLTLNESTSDKFKLLDGGGSDELSFYMGEIPAISFWNDYSGIEKTYDNAENDIMSLDIYEMKKFCESIVNMLVNFKIDLYDDILKNNEKIKSDITDIDIQSIGDFKLDDKSQILLKNGYDVQEIYTYKNSLGKVFTIKESSSRFISKDTIKELTRFDNLNTDGYKLSKSDKFKISYTKGFVYGEIEGNVSNDELIDLFNKYYSSYSEYKITN